MWYHHHRIINRFFKTRETEKSHDPDPCQVPCNFKITFISKENIKSFFIYARIKNAEPSFDHRVMMMMVMMVWGMEISVLLLKQVFSHNQDLTQQNPNLFLCILELSLDPCSIINRFLDLLVLLLEFLLQLLDQVI